MRAVVACFALVGFACEVPTTVVAVENQYPTASNDVVYRAFWQAVRFDMPLAPGNTSDELPTVPASANTAYALLAPGFDPASTTRPTSIVVLESKSGFSIPLDTTLHIPIDDTTFAGNCAAGSFLSQDQADFVTERVFQADMTGLIYDAATCTTRSAP